MPDWKPDGYTSVSPYLVSPDAQGLINFLGNVFGATLLRRFDRPDGSLMHAEVKIDDSVVMIGGGATDWRSGDAHLHVYVEDAAAAYERAMAFDAPSVQVPERKREDDDLRGGFRDPDGNTWWVASQ
ncbi:extradiol dioxygenase [Zhengella mangrovi]|uniref:Extradiol dioxygenase n=1 Tax=Zhengella mangrovi TaxID=1982044 RepID=A0A2G1QNC1_9HYPH|nr:VOC family protein [Zhengella mangrovi]PHP67002.1 extradiol dioxygenase [Zhengella mangrovi]